MMYISEDAVQMIARHEGLRLRAYRDAVGVWTIGYGHTAMAGAPFPKDGMTITLSEAVAILRRDIAAVEQQVLSLVTVPISINHLGALVSFAFNVGTDVDADTKAEGLGDSTLLRHVNAGRFDAAAAEFSKWVKADGRTLPGLVKRREEERQLFLKPGPSWPRANPPSPSTDQSTKTDLQPLPPRQPVPSLPPVPPPQPQPEKKGNIMDSVIKSIIGKVVRHGLTAAAGALVAKGVVDPELAKNATSAILPGLIELIAGAAVGSAGLGWSVWRIGKKRI
jgi:lysozyme